MDFSSPQSNNRTWRDEVMDESLRAMNNSNFDDGFLYAFRQAEPSWATALLHCNRLHATTFIHKHGGDVRSLLQGEHSFHSGNQEVMYYLEWLGFEWQGRALEVAFLPQMNNNPPMFVLSSDCDSDLLTRFVEELRDYAIRPLHRCLRFAGGWESAPDFDEQLGRITWDDITLPAEMLYQLRESVEGFFAQRDLMREFGFAWRRGILLIGPPGTGKTMVCKAIASATDLPFLYVSALSNNNNIAQIFKRARKLAPCILAFEDMDGFMGEHNRTIFLNEIDGFASNDGLLVIASSNHPGKIDEALLKRPSRFDRVFHLGLPALPERRAFCEKILGRSSLASHLAGDLDVADLCAKVAQKTDGFTPAYLKEAFTAAALHCAQQGIAPLDHRFADAVLAQVDELKAHLKKVKNPDALAEMRSGDDAIGFRR